LISRAYRRLWVPVVAPETHITLDGERSHYLCRVLRARKEDEILCFNGTGTEIKATVAQANPKECRLDLGKPTRIVEAPPHTLHLANALIKVDLASVIQKATELGVTDLWFLAADHSEGRPLSKDRANRIARSACEQCGRVYVPILHPVMSLAEFFDVCPASVKLMLNQGGSPMLQNMKPNDFTLLVGPEGGWSQPELDLARVSGASEIGLGSLTLRANTVGIAALSSLRQSIGWEVAVL
jgi:16S rRNA (uracil1498-N3)-methyltransferase